MVAFIALHKSRLDSMSNLKMTAFILDSASRKKQQGSSASSIARAYSTHGFKAKRCCTTIALFIYQVAFPSGARLVSLISPCLSESVSNSPDSTMAYFAERLEMVASCMNQTTYIWSK